MRFTRAFVCWLLWAGGSQAEPFGANEFDTGFSDTAAVQYQIDRSCLANLANC